MTVPDILKRLVRKQRRIVSIMADMIADEEIRDASKQDLKRYYDEWHQLLQMHQGGKLKPEDLLDSLASWSKSVGPLMLGIITEMWCPWMYQRVTKESWAELIEVLNERETMLKRGAVLVDVHGGKLA